MKIYTVICTMVDDVFAKESFTSYDKAVKYLDELEKEFGEHADRAAEDSLYNNETQAGYGIFESDLETSNDEIEKLVKIEKKTLWQQMCKVTEEVGELSGALLSNEKAHGSGYKNIPDEEVLREFADVILTVKSVFYTYGKFTDEELEKAILAKCEKWKLNQKRG